MQGVSDRMARGGTGKDKARADRRCSDCFLARTLASVRRNGVQMVYCNAAHWRMEHPIDSLPEDIAQSCADFEDMDEEVG